MIVDLRRRIKRVRRGHVAVGPAGPRWQTHMESRRQHRVEAIRHVRGHEFTDSADAPRSLARTAKPGCRQLLVINRRLESGVTGSLFAGRGAVLGLPAEVFEDVDSVQNAIVR